MSRSMLVGLFCVGWSVACDGASVLMVLTSNDELGESKNATGWYLPEAAHPYVVFKDAEVDMTWASPKGGEAPLDPGSVAPYEKDENCMDFKDGDAWKTTTKLEDIDPDDFDAVFVVGGYGVMWDLVKDKDLEKIVTSIYESGGIVSGVCHGPAALLHMKLSDGSSLVEGKDLAGFTNAEEGDMGRADVVPFTIEDEAKKVGAQYTKGDHWTDHVAKAGRLITGQNPMSAKSVAEAVVKALKTEGIMQRFELGSHVGVSQPSQTGSIAALCGGFAFFVMAVAALRVFRGQRQDIIEEEADALLE